jgi:hypothetical protein
MRSSPGAALDRRIEAMIVSWVRRQWPVLRIVPVGLIRPAVAPTALRLRRSIVRATFVIAIPAAVVVAALAL